MNTVNTLDIEVYQHLAMERPPHRTVKDPQDFDFVQPKYDGQYCVIKIHGDDISYYTRTGTLIGHGTMPEIKHNESSGNALYVHQAVLIGEIMRGTQWANKRNEAEWTVYLFDMIFFNKVDIRKSDYYFRYSKLLQLVTSETLPMTMKIVPNFELQHFERVWKIYCENDNFEGVVLRNNDTFGQPIARIKKTFTMDYVCMGFTEGSGKYTGQVAGVIGGLYNDEGELVETCTVGGLVEYERLFYTHKGDKLIGKVFTAEGYQVFESGALRHPSLHRVYADNKFTGQAVIIDVDEGMHIIQIELTAFRDDKEAITCRKAQ